MSKLDNSLLTQLENLDKALCSTIKKSSYESALEIFETVQVHLGCGGCYGTQISCTSDEFGQ